MYWIIGAYIILISIANLALIVFLFYDRYKAFKKQGEIAGKEVMREHFQTIQLQEQKILDEFRTSMQTVIAQTQLSGQQMLERLNDYMIKAHTDNLGRFNEFSAKLYSVLVDSGNHFSQQLQQYVGDANKRIDEWQHSYIEIMKHEIDGIIETERAKLTAFTEDEQKRIEAYMREMVSKELGMIAEEVLSNSISVKDQEKLVSQAVEKFFKDV